MGGGLDLFPYSGKIKSMEAILNLFVFHDSYVVSFLVVGITIVVVMLLLFNQKSPEAVVRTEVEGGSDPIEGALRRVLGEKQWELASHVPSGRDDNSVRLVELEEEVLNKDRAIAELNKQLTQSGGGGSGGGDSSVTADNSDLMARINELEERLVEYEIIEDDIADLSLYKTENEKLKEELQSLRARLGGAAPSAVEDPGAPVVAVPEEVVPPPLESTEPEAEEADTKVAEMTPEPQETDTQAADLVAEFEKVVNNQGSLEEDESSSRVSNQGEEENTGRVVVSNGSPASSSEPVDLKTELKVHPQLRGVNPDSKEEAEIFISELKSLKKG